MAEASGTWNKLVSFSEEVGRSGGGDSPQSGDEDEAFELNLSLVERMVSGKPLNKVGLRVAIFRSGHFVQNLEIEKVEGDGFIFSFPNKESWQRVLDQAPWTIRGFPLVLQARRPRETVTEVDLVNILVWIQVHGLPFGPNNKIQGGMHGK